MNVDHRRMRFIQGMGIGPVWELRDSSGERSGVQNAADEGIRVSENDSPLRSDQNAFAPAEAPSSPAVQAVGAAPRADEVSRMDWLQLKENVASCVKCRLCQTRTKTVFGTGDETADWLFVGEGPGRNEDLQGEPFIGPAGKLLDNMLLSIGLGRGKNAYIANTVKCRPVGDDGRDRPPALDEAEACRPYLERQIALIQPKIIVALGKTAAISLLGLDPDTPVTKLRGTVHQYRGLPLVVTYHPAYLLRKLSEKSKSWSDLCLAMRTYGDIPR